MSQLTVCIKTHLRPQSLQRCLRSVFTYLPRCDVVVCDDAQPADYAVHSVPELNDERVSYQAAQYDIGISAGRNLMLLSVHTPFILLLDDDHVLTASTHAEQAVQALLDANYDLCGLQPATPNGAREYFSGMMRVKNKRLYVEPLCEAGPIAPYLLAHLTPHPFVARTEAVKAVRWDSELKICEHWDFHFRFMKAGYRAMQGPHHIVEHARGQRDKAYLHMRRDRAAHYKKLALQKHGLKEIVFK